MPKLFLPPCTRVSVSSRLLHFKRPAGTSRGVYTTRKVWYVHIASAYDATHVGTGECAPLPDLSCDALPHYEYILGRFCREFEQRGSLTVTDLLPYPSILFGLETALRHYERRSFALCDTPFSQGESGVPINGLIWMADFDDMLSQIETKMAAGFRCIKLKIGAIGFEEELALLAHIRSLYTAREIELRVDANGAFTPPDALEKLQRLAALDLHSIEQPIRAGQWQHMAALAAQTPLPIALDEELIGINTPDDKQRMLDTIRPQYIILKPSLHGGIRGCDEWIRLAESRGIGWWATSALESNIGLNAIAHWAASHNNPLPQGLGTGRLFENNIDMPLYIQGDCLHYHAPLAHFLDEWHSPAATVMVQTSGSTGTPKQLPMRKDKMQQSARITCEQLGVTPGHTALLCLPLSYIAGKMMVVRALTMGLELMVQKPTGHPLAQVDHVPHFVAMTPMQVYNSLSVPAEAQRLREVGVLIIGGGALDKDTEAALAGFPNPVYATYGMAETLSNIALRRLSGTEASAYFTPFASVKLSLAADGTLIIDAPLVSDEVLKTNDIAELLPDGRFRIIGRRDNVINSGGIKLQIEAIEEKLRPHLSAPFAITFVPDARLGQAVVLLSTATVNETQIRTRLANHECPRHVFIVAHIPQTHTGKTNREACRLMAQQCFTNK